MTAPTPPLAGAPDLPQPTTTNCTIDGGNSKAQQIYLNMDERPEWSTWPIGARAFLAHAAPVAQSVSVPEGMALVPHYRGYARLGTGQYLMNHSAVGTDASFIISVATDAEKSGRVVGDESENAPGSLLQPEAMAIRIDFASVEGLDAMENQLRKLRVAHFPAAPLPQPQADAPFDIFCDDVRVDVRAHYRAKHGMNLPPTPTMSGAEIRVASDNKNPHYTLYLSGTEPFDLTPIADAEAIPLAHGAQFHTIPPATY